MVGMGRGGGHRRTRRRANREGGVSYGRRRPLVIRCRTIHAKSPNHGVRPRTPLRKLHVRVLKHLVLKGVS
jgi:hypothetical protein